VIFVLRWMKLLVCPLPLARCHVVVTRKIRASTVSSDAGSGRSCTLLAAIAANEESVEGLEEFAYYLATRGGE
jgi:hypothetical protein